LHTGPPSAPGLVGSRFVGKQLLAHYTVFQKSKPLDVWFDNNFGKCGPIFKILSPGDS